MAHRSQLDATDQWATSHLAKFGASAAAPASRPSPQHTIMGACREAARRWVENVDLHLEIEQDPATNALVIWIPVLHAMGHNQWTGSIVWYQQRG